MRRVPATLITGFLGAGKKSLVRYPLEEARGRRLAVLVNQFGERGIDRELQLGCANLVILNQTDLIAGETLTEPRGEKTRLRVGVKLIAARDGSVPPEGVLGLADAAEHDLAERPFVPDAAAAHDHDDFETCSVALGAVADGASALAKLDSVTAAHGVLRIKRFGNVLGGDRVQSAFDPPWRTDETRATPLVVVGPNGLDRAAIAPALGS